MYMDKEKIRKLVEDELKRILSHESNDEEELNEEDYEEESYEDEDFGEIMEIEHEYPERLDSLQFKEELIITRINNMLKETNKFTHKNALSYGIASSSTIYYKILGFLRIKKLVYFRDGIPYIDRKKWALFMRLYENDKVRLFRRMSKFDTF
jgi:hypothetical protein